MFRKWVVHSWFFILIVLFWIPSSSIANPGMAKQEGRGTSVDSEKTKMTEGVSGKDKVIYQNVEVEFLVDSLSGKEVLEGDYAIIRFRVKDATTGAPLPALRPSVWLDIKKEMKGEKIKAPLTCKDKIGLYLQGSLGYRPDIDLNSYFILSLNNDGSISVTDPIISFRGITQLYTMIYLKRPGEDWVLSSDEKRLFVTLPRADQLAVVNTETFKVVKDIPSGSNPVRVALQPDGKYLWVGNDASETDRSGVTVIDSEALSVVAQIPTGGGHHEIAFTEDSLYAFVSNKGEGTLSIIDVQKLRKVKDLQIGRDPVAIAFSSLSKSVYVANEGDGTVAVVSGTNHEITQRIRMSPGIRALRLAPGGRFGFVANGKENKVTVFDVSNNQVLHRIEVGKEPDQVSFTSAFAYVRSRGTAEVSLIALASLGKEGSLPVVTVSGGQKPPGASPYSSVADAIIPTPEPGHVLITNPADSTIYYYMEGMQFPMGSFRSYGGTVQKAVRVVDRSLREKEQGVYESKVRIPTSGQYEVAFLLDTPRVLHCFEFSAKPNPALPKKGGIPRIEFITEERKATTGKEFTLRFRLIDPAEDEPIKGLKDVNVQATLAPSAWYERFRVQDSGEGVYELNFKPPQKGVYYLTFSCPSLKLNHTQIPYLIIRVQEENAGK